MCECVCACEAGAVTQFSSHPQQSTVDCPRGLLLHSQDALLPSSDGTDSRQLELDRDLQTDSYWCRGLGLLWGVRRCFWDLKRESFDQASFQSCRWAPLRLLIGGLYMYLLEYSLTLFINPYVFQWWQSTFGEVWHRRELDYNSVLVRTFIITKCSLSVEKPELSPFIIAACHLYVITAVILEIMWAIAQINGNLANSHF